MIDLAVFFQLSQVCFTLIWWQYYEDLTAFLRRKSWVKHANPCFERKVTKFQQWHLIRVWITSSHGRCTVRSWDNSLPSFLSLPLQRVITSQHWSAFWQWFPFPLFPLFKASAPKRKGRKKKAGGPKWAVKNRGIKVNELVLGAQMGPSIGDIHKMFFIWFPHSV